MKNDKALIESLILQLRNNLIDDAITVLESLLPIEEVKEPFEVGKTYKTRFQTGENFLVKEIIKDKKGEVVKFNGIYELHPDIGICPLNADRLIQ